MIKVYAQMWLKYKIYLKLYKIILWREEEEDYWRNVINKIIRFLLTSNQIQGDIRAGNLGVLV